MGAFKKAVKKDLKLRLAITGPAGSGKTYTALRIACAMGLPVAYIDTEHGSAAKYADLFDFDVMEMRPPFHPERFVKGIQMAAKEGYAVVVIDSLTHAWNGTGGILDLVEEASARLRGNSYAAWKDVTPIQNELTEAIVGSGIHIIACMRSKMDYVQQKDDKGYTKIEKVGMAPVQREGFEYEFDVVMDMDIKHNGIITKTRCPDLTDRVYKFPGEDVAGILSKWLGSGAAVIDIEAAKKAESPKPQGALATNDVSTSDYYAVDQSDVAMTAEEAMGFGVEAAASENGDFLLNTYRQAWADLTGKSYDLVQWLSDLHRKEGGPCTPAQYGHLVAVMDALTNDNHGYYLSVLCQSEISKSNMPGCKVAKALLDILPKTIKVKGEDGTEQEVPNPKYRADIAEMITEMSYPWSSPAIPNEHGSLN